MKTKMQLPKNINPLSVQSVTAVETLRYVRKFCGQTILIKLGGATLESPEIVSRLCDDFALIRSAGISLVIVHGGGKAINQELEKNQISWDFTDGQRVTTPEMMKVIEMVLCGKVNRHIVRILNATGIDAVGLSGADGKMFQCVRAHELKYGEVGHIEKINAELIRGYLDSQKESGEGFIPVVAPLGVDSSGLALNINADWAASRLAQELQIKKMIFLTDQNGIYDFKGKLFSELNKSRLEALIEKKIVTDGMLAKAQAILQALDCGVENVHVVNGKRPHSLIEELFTDKGIGTVCRLDPQAH